ncbi:MAG: FdtA/QdtA family cupin domain-containing protein [Bacteroidia bacterium]|nr:FdtA/QdtA family cupin domain-containing protein [Bacteroidia bacterium]
MNTPHIIEFPKLGTPEIGYISVAENNKNIPFEVKRVFWSYHTPDNVVRGRHAHHNTEMILIATLGRIVVNTEMPNGDLNVFSLETPNQGLYLPKYCWHTMQYSHIAVQLVLASELYNEADYIRSYNDFLKLKL